MLDIDIDHKITFNFSKLESRTGNSCEFKYKFDISEVFEKHENLQKYECGVHEISRFDNI